MNLVVPPTMFVSNSFLESAIIQFWRFRYDPYASTDSSQEILLERQAVAIHFFPVGIYSSYSFDKATNAVTSSKAY